jgi:uncharacterized membrane protein YgcG
VPPTPGAAAAAAAAAASPKHAYAAESNVAFIPLRITRPTLQIQVKWERDRGERYGMVFVANAHDVAAPEEEWCKTFDEVKQRRELSEGLVLCKVDDRDLSGMDYDEVKGLLANKSRPMTLTWRSKPVGAAGFSAGATAAATVPTPAPAAAPVVPMMPKFPTAVPAPAPASASSKSAFFGGGGGGGDFFGGGGGADDWSF